MIVCCGEPAAISLAGELSREEMEQQRGRLERELARLQQEEETLRAKLEDAEFLSRAPALVREKTHGRYAATQERLRAVEAQLSELSELLGGETRT